MGNKTDGERGLTASIGRRASRVVAAVAASSLVVACAALDEVFNPPASETQEPATVAAPAPAPEEALPRAPRPRPTRTARLPAPADRAPAPPAAEQQPETPPEPAPEIKLVGLSRNEAVTLFGAPKGEREAAPAKIWEFTDGECVLDVYFYLDVARNDFYALHYDVRDANGAMAGPAADRCLQRLYSENHR